MNSGYLLRSSALRLVAAPLDARGERLMLTGFHAVARRASLPAGRGRDDVGANLGDGVICAAGAEQSTAGTSRLRVRARPAVAEAPAAT